MRKRVKKELREYEQVISMINNRDELFKELREIDKRNYKNATLVSTVGVVMGTTVTGLSLEKLISSYIETNDLNYGGLIILIGGLVLAGFGINDFITARENKYIDSEKIKIVSRQVKPENGPLGKIKTK